MNKVMSRDDLEKLKKECKFIIKINRDYKNGIKQVIKEIGNEEALECGLFDKINILAEESSFMLRHIKTLNSHLALLDQKDSKLDQAVELLGELVSNSAEPHGILRVMICKHCKSMYNDEHADGCPVAKAQAFIKEVKG